MPAEGKEKKSVLKSKARVPKHAFSKYSVAFVALLSIRQLFGLRAKNARAENPLVNYGIQRNAEMLAFWDACSKRSVLTMRFGLSKGKRSQKSSNLFFDNFRAAPIFRPLLGGSDSRSGNKHRGVSNSQRLQPLQREQAPQDLSATFSIVSHSREENSMSMHNCSTTAMTTLFFSQKNSRRLELSIFKTSRTEGGDEVRAVWTQGSRQVGLSRCPKS